MDSNHPSPSQTWLRSGRPFTSSFKVRGDGIEPSTSSLSEKRSTTELLAQIFKDALYQMLAP